MRVKSRYQCQKGMGGCGFKFSARRPIERMDDVTCPACEASNRVPRRRRVHGEVVWQKPIVRLEEGPAEVLVLENVSVDESLVEQAQQGAVSADQP